MKVKAYTKSHDEEVLKNIGNNGGQFTPEEHAYALKKQYEDKFKSTQSVLHWSIYPYPWRLTPLDFLIEHIKKESIKDILSLGAGTGYLEYLLKCILPPKSRVITTDFDPFLIDNAREMLPGPIYLEFDFFKDKVALIREGAGFIPEVAVFFGSAYVMDDDQFVALFKDLKANGVREIIDFHAGYLDLEHLINYYLSFIKKNPTVRKIFSRPQESSHPGKFHGYYRTRNELRRLYKKSGFHLVKETSSGHYKYIAICKNKSVSPSQ